MLPRSIRALATLTLLAVAAAADQSGPQAPYGAYLGCFELEKLPVNASRVARFSAGTIAKCMPFCNGLRHSMHAISRRNHCWCLSLIPDESARLPEAECSSSEGSGVPLFYRYKDASNTMCRLAPVPFKRTNFNIHYNQDHANFTVADGKTEMVLEQHGRDGIRLTTIDGSHLYGQYQVSAMVSGASGVVTAFYVRSTDVYTLANDDSPFSEIDIEWLNGNPAVSNSLWLNSYKNGLSGGETLVRPPSYQQLLNLPSDATAANTWITYSFNWQPDQLTWSLNGVPLLKRTYDEQVSWMDMKGLPFSRAFRPPDQASHVTFSMWSDGDPSRAFGGKLDVSQSPFRSYFRGLKRILCDQPLPSDPAEAAAALGPPWLFNKSNNAVDKSSGVSSNSVSKSDSTVSGSSSSSSSYSKASSSSEGSSANAELNSSTTSSVTDSSANASSNSASKANAPGSSTAASASTASSDSGSTRSSFSSPGSSTTDSSTRSSGSSSGSGGGSSSSLSAESGKVKTQTSFAPSTSVKPAADAAAYVPSAGPTLADLLAYEGMTLATSSPDGQQALCLEFWKNTIKGGGTTSAITRLGVYNCSSSSLLWSYNKNSQVLTTIGLGKGRGNKCLTDLAGEPFAAPCSPSGSASSPAQQWSLEGGRLRSRTGLCVGLDAAAAAAAAGSWPHLTDVPCGSNQELMWDAGENEVLLYLKPAKPLTMYHPEAGYCLAANTESTIASDLVPDILVVRPCLPVPSANPSWYFKTSTRQIQRKDANLCLTGVRGAGVTMTKCAEVGDGSEALAPQMWFMAPSGQLQTSTGVCVGVNDDGLVVGAACEGDRWASWSFGGDNPLKLLTPGYTLTHSKGDVLSVLSIIVETAVAGQSFYFLGLKPNTSNSSALVWTFNEATGQIAANGQFTGQCLTSRNDLKALQLMPCLEKEQALFKTQAWIWYGGQLKNMGDGKCLAVADEDAEQAVNPGGVRLAPVSCPRVQPENKVTWGFAGQAPTM